MQLKVRMVPIATPDNRERMRIGDKKSLPSEPPSTRRLCRRRRTPWQLPPIEAAAARLPANQGKEASIGLYPFTQSEEAKGPILSADIDQFGPLTKNRN
jgi:hypothetical protein